MSDDLAAALPFLVLAGGAGAIAIADRIVAADPRAWSVLGAAIAVAAGVSAVLPAASAEGFGGVLRRDGAFVFCAALVAGGAAAALLLGAARPSGPAPLAAELCALVLFSASGAVLAAGAGDLLVLLVGVELMAVPLHAAGGLSLAGRRGSAGATEQLLAGAGATAALAYGAALVYAATGSLAIGAAASAATSAIGVAGLALVAASLAARAGLVPLHLWTPPAYASAPAGVAAFMAVAIQVTAFAALLRVGGAITAVEGVMLDWRASVAVLAGLTVSVGVLAALRGTTLRGVAVWSSIAHAGVVAVAAAAGAAANAAAAFALATGALATIGVVAASSLAGPALSDLHGLARRRPVFVAALAVLMLALAGLPPTAGFVARLSVLEAAVGAQLAWLAFVTALASVAGAIACLRVVSACFEEGDQAPGRPSVAGAVVVAAALALLATGLVPGPLLDAAQGVRF